MWWCQWLNFKYSGVVDHEKLSIIAGLTFFPFKIEFNKRVWVFMLIVTLLKLGIALIL